MLLARRFIRRRWCLRWTSTSWAEGFPSHRGGRNETSRHRGGFWFLGLRQQEPCVPFLCRAVGCDFESWSSSLLLSSASCVVSSSSPISS
ncbi:hypothetical protein PMAYCL1PPCAC_22799 [Pristionchus mayeri]|uniref:Uncharacterized protein n=1 Tax=Pristionchus mayeri TaxID=1317129 RepID=A0AAN5I5U6_9BILA|nr:hypothetical protein PMAYCL1PPCAC_22799 [Pristionchus mayeri]